MHISEFKIGEEIVRVEAAKSLGSYETMTGQVINRGGDRSYLGEKMQFRGTANGMIYLIRSNESMISMTGNNKCNMTLDLWADGWDKWIDPECLIDGVMSKSELQKQIDMALEKENYELAEKLTKKLNKK